MKDTIYRRAAIDVYCKYCAWDCKTNGDIHFGCRALNELNNLPSAQPYIDTGLYTDGFNDGYRQAQIEIIRCKDCKLYRTPMPEETYCSITGFGVDNNDFCSYAERRTDDSISH